MREKRSSRPKFPFSSLSNACNGGKGYVKQDTWHVWKPIFWYMQFYHALLSKRTCGYYLCFFFWFPLFLKFFIIHPSPTTRHPSPAEKSCRESNTARKMAQVKERGGGGEEMKETFPSSHFHFLNLASFLVRPKPRIPFFGLFCSETKRKRLLRRLVFNEMILNSLSWFFIRSTSQCSEGINFDWLNGWKCWTLAKTFAWRRVKQDSRNGGHLKWFQ